MIRYSVLGAKGFIGSHFRSAMLANGVDCVAIDRDYKFSRAENLGHVIYAIGLTADFRKRPMDTVRAHVSKLVDVLESARFDSFLYLSSTRVYSDNRATDEGVSLCVNPNSFSDLYNISKLMGESVCLSINNPAVRIARLSNVLGNDFESENFVSSLIREALSDGKVVLQTSPDSEKDYIFIDDVVQHLARIAVRGKHRLYNVASGVNISNREIVEMIQRSIGCPVEMDSSKPLSKFSAISVKRLKEEFNYTSALIGAQIEAIIQNFKQNYHGKD